MLQIPLRFRFRIRRFSAVVMVLMCWMGLRACTYYMLAYNTLILKNHANNVKEKLYMQASMFLADVKFSVFDMHRVTHFLQCLGLISNEQSA